MALDSIAKLSVLITGDESPLAASAKRAEGIVASAASRIEDPWKRGLAVMKAMNDPWARGLEELKRQADAKSNPFDSLATGASRYTQVAAQSSMQTSLLSGAVLKGALGFSALAGGVVFATRALVDFAADATRGAIEQEQAIADANKTWGDQEKKIRTTAGQLEIFRKHSVAPVKDTIGSILSRDLREALAVINVATGAMNRFKAEQEIAATKTEERIAQLRKWGSEHHGDKAPGFLLKKDASELRSLEDLMNRQKMSDWTKEGDKAIAESQLRAGLMMESRAEQIKQMLLTPLESYTAKMQELQQLVDQGMLSTQFFERAAAKARADLEGAKSAREAAMEASQSPVAAVERYTMAGFSAVQQARQAQDDKRVEKEQLQVQKQELGVLQHIDQVLQEQGFPRLQLSRLQ